MLISKHPENIKAHAYPPTYPFIAHVKDFPQNKILVTWIHPHSCPVIFRVFGSVLLFSNFVETVNILVINKLFAGIHTTVLSIL